MTRPARWAAPTCSSTSRTSAKRSVQNFPRRVAGPMAVSQRPLSAAALTENATAAGWKSLPSWYLVSERDNAIPPDCERFMAQRAGAVTESVDGSHVAFIAHPDVAAGLILKAAA